MHRWGAAAAIAQRRSWCEPGAQGHSDSSSSSSSSSDNNSRKHTTLNNDKDDNNSNDDEGGGGGGDGRRRRRHCRSKAAASSEPLFARGSRWRGWPRSFQAYCDEKQQQPPPSPPPPPASLSLANIPSRQEQLRALKTLEDCDVLIVGGGATGAGIALDAASRGLKAVLVERDDFASGTSSRSTKLLHGGVR